jgi:hypothetical protein
MIRRAFWLGAGAAAGIMSYRRVCAIGRKLSGRVTGAPGARSAPGVLRMARETVRFTRDVREGMELYIARHDRPAPDTLTPREHSREHSRESHGYDQKDGR